MHYYRSSLYHAQRYHHHPRPATTAPPPWAVAAVLWVTVSLSLCFGYYGNKQMVLGPNSSRVLSVSSVFVRQVQVRGAAGGAPGLLLYGFAGEAPAASSLSNWTLSRLMTVGAYGRRGFSLWLNRGSVLKIRWRVVDIDGGLTAESVMVVLFKEAEERNLELLQQYYYPTTTSYNKSRESTTEGVLECSVGEDGSYYVGAGNLNPRAVSVSMAVEVSAKMYDVTGATFSCSMGGGDRCKMELLFPKTQYAVLVTPGGDETGDAWYVEISFVTRLMTYVGLVGLVAALLWIFLRYVNACTEERSAAAQTETAPAPAETDPIMAAARAKAAPCSYGATEEDPETAAGPRRCSSEDLYEGKLCVICYEEGRNCFFTPCGHCATCHDCAKRIMEEESKVCPICRRLIHKVRRLLSP